VFASITCRKLSLLACEQSGARAPWEIQCYSGMRKTRIVIYIPSNCPSPTKRIPGIALGKARRSR